MKIQILDYSTTRIAAPLFRNYLPEDAEIIDFFVDSAEALQPAVEQTGVTHVLHSGSALSINHELPFLPLAVDYIRDLSRRGVKQMGICFGHQLICRALVGKHAVQASPNGLEAGWCEVQFADGENTIPGLSGSEIMWQHHFDEVIELPAGSELLASAEHTTIQAYVNRELHLLGMQFHPEFDRTSGNQYFLNDRQLLEQQGFNVEELIQGSPSGNHGRSVFDYFLSQS